MEDTMRKFFRTFFDILSLPSLFGEIPKGYRITYKQGATVIASADFDNERLELFLQHPIEALDVRNGKLVSTVRTGVRRRGGKRQTGIVLSIDEAEALYNVLGKTLKNVKAHHHQKEILERVGHSFEYIVRIEATETDVS